MLTRQKGSNDKRGIGNNNATHKSQSTFVQSAYKHRRLLTCSYCCKEGHLISSRIYFLLNYFEI